MSARTGWVLVAWMAAALAIASPATADEGEGDATAEVEEAQRLLREADADHAAGRHDRAADGFRSAVEVLRRTSADTIALANALNGWGAALLDVGKPLEAVAALEEALAIRRRVKAPDSVEGATLVHNLALAYGEVGRLGDAVAPAEEALAMALRVFPPEGPEVLSHRSTLAEAYAHAGRYEDAVPLAERTLADRKRLLGPDHEDVGVSLTILVATYRQLGRYADAIPYAQEALDLARRLRRGDHREVVVGLDNLGLLVLAVGRHEEALALRREAVNMARRLPPDDGWLALTIGNLAYTLATSGRPAEALPLMEETLLLARRAFPEVHPRVALALDNLAGMYQATGRPLDALPLLEEALPMWRRIHPEGHTDVAICLDNLGTVYEGLGRTEDAVRTMEEALRMWESLFLGDHAEVAVSLANLGGAYAASGRLPDAVATQTRAVAMWRRIFTGDHPQVASSLSGLATTLRLAGRAEDALPLQEESLAMWRALFKGDHAGVAAALHNLAGIHAALGRHADALVALEEAAAMGDRLATGETHTTWTSLGHAYVHAGRLPEAASAYEKAMRRVDLLRSRTRSMGAAERLSYSARIRLDDPYTAMVGLEVRRDRPADALAALERGRAREFLDLLERSAVDPLQRAEERARAAGDAALLRRIEESRGTVARAEASVLTSERAERAAAREGGRSAIRKARSESAKARHQLLDALDRQSRLVGDLVPEATASDPRAIQAALAPDERVLLYSLGPSASYVFLLAPSPAPVRVFPLRAGERPLGASEIEEPVRAYVEAVSGDTRPPVPVAAGEELFRRLLPEEAWAEVRSVRRVVVVAHGALHSLPFDALVVGTRDGRPRYWLDEGPAVAYASSGSVLAGLRARREALPPAEGGRSLLAVGDPVFLAAAPASPAGEGGALARTARSRARRLAPLPGTRTEVEDVRRAFLEAGASPERLAVLLGRDSTERRVYDAAAGARYVHLATHGLVDETGAASFSALALSVPAAPAPDDDGFLSLMDLLTRWRERLASAELVVLSACETHRGPVQREDGIFALPWGFHYAGCPTVVATLWPVVDVTTPELMGAFYRRVLAGEAKLESLTAAKKALRAKHPHPYDWAPFVMLGDPR